MKGVILNGLLPDATSVLAIMDDIFRASKNVFRLSTYQHFTRKTKATTKAILRRNSNIADKIAAGIEVTEAEQKKAKYRLIVGLNPGDLGPILFRKLPKDGYYASNAHIITAFTKGKVLEAHRKVWRHIFHHILLFHHIMLPFFTAWI